MSKQNKAVESEPTMDEILASIKSIISEDVKQVNPTPPAPATNVNVAAPQKEAAPEKDVLELTEMVSEDGSVVSLQQQEGLLTPPSIPETSIKDVPEKKVLPPAVEAQPVSAQETISDEPVHAPALEAKEDTKEIISEDAFTESMKALKSLEALSQPVLKEASANMDGGKTLENLMEDILRPMLRQWIDANLPSLVKVIVTEQVEKVIKEYSKKN